MYIKRALIYQGVLNEGKKWSEDSFFWENIGAGRLMDRFPDYLQFLYKEIKSLQNVVCGMELSDSETFVGVVPFFVGAATTTQWVKQTSSLYIFLRYKIIYVA